jgi:hypothetical protein
VVPAGKSEDFPVFPRSRKLQIAEGEGETVLTVLGSAPLDRPDPGITRAIIMIHGSGDIGLSWAQDFEERAEKRRRGASTLVVAAPRLRPQESLHL